MLKDYLDKALSNGQIRYFKSLIKALILFIPKKNGFLYLYIDYKAFNKLTIKNRYPLLLINKILAKLNKAKFLMKLNLKDIYYRFKIKKGDE